MYEITIASGGEHVKDFDTLEDAEDFARRLLGVRVPVITGPHVDEHTGAKFWGWFLSAAHARHVESGVDGAGGLHINEVDP